MNFMVEQSKEDRETIDESGKVLDVEKTSPFGRIVTNFQVAIQISVSKEKAIEVVYNFDITPLAVSLAGIQEVFIMEVTID